ncbi:phosphoglycerate dehydrogenase [Teratosphaeria nubilosa]|uniref:Phosphoglycerate dehydrogenase n=1 Tax=Teratosphaeria nubilosa TaxID=161662 RepID=A0A6G1L133_9PEZI|nr:phosphoglycerate dehydrogenase [Teratosphaeria nubilosa]
MAAVPVSQDQPSYTILEADGQHPDSALEETIFNAPRLDPSQPSVKVRFLRGALSPSGTADLHPWTNIPKELRDEIDGLMILKLYLTAEDIELFPKLKVVVRMGVGYDRLDRVTLAKKGVTVCNVPDYGSEEIADHAIALTLGLRRGVLMHHDMQRRVPEPAPYCPVSSPLIARSRGAVFGIFGLGRIGTATALRAKAFGFHVLFYDPYLPNGSDKALGVERTRNVQDLFRRSSILSIHAPATRETRNFIDYDLLSLMPRDAVLVNTARGEIVDLDGVERCLKEGILAGAGLDVLPVEPPVEPVHSLIQAYRKKEDWLEGRLVLTCHTAFFSPSSLQEIREKSAITMREVLIDKLQSNVITPDME